MGAERALNVYSGQETAVLSPPPQDPSQVPSPGGLCLLVRRDRRNIWSKPAASGNVGMGLRTFTWTVAFIVTSAAFARSDELPARAPPRAPVLASAPVFKLARFYIGANSGVDWSTGKNNVLARGRLGYDFRSGAFAIAIESDTQKNALHWRQIELDATPTVSAAGKTYGSFDPTNPRTFGGLALFAVEKMPPVAADFAKRLKRTGDDRQMRDALLGPDGVLSASNVKKSLFELGVVVQGVNDQRMDDERTDVDYSAATGQQIQSYPLSAAALADQQSRTARYGNGDAATNGGANVMASGNLATAAHSVRGRAFDASEGTPLDPLLNVTYDLNYPKVVPSLK